MFLCVPSTTKKSKKIWQRKKNILRCQKKRKGHDSHIQSIIIIMNALAHGPNLHATRYNFCIWNIKYKRVLTYTTRTSEIIYAHVIHNTRQTMQFVANATVIRAYKRRTLHILYIYACISRECCMQQQQLERSQRIRIRDTLMKGCMIIIINNMNIILSFSIVYICIAGWPVVLHMYCSIRSMCMCVCMCAACTSEHPMPHNACLSKWRVFFANANFISRVLSAIRSVLQEHLMSNRLRGCSLKHQRTDKKRFW